VGRCEWANAPALHGYHDVEWGVPEHDDARLYEKLTLEGAQAGLSWATILNKREGYRRLFEGFDATRVSRFNEDDIARLLQDAGIVRHRKKIESTISNARAVLAVQEECGSLDAYIWGFVDGRPIVNRHGSLQELPAQTELSMKLSKDLKRRGFRFVGPTTAYAFMQAAGLVNDHLVSCPRWKALA